MVRLDTDTRQRQIAEAALKIIGEQGLGRFTTAAIAAEVGISEGTIFRHFESKEAIVHGAMDRVEALLFDDFPPEAPDPLARLGVFFRDRATLFLAQPALGQVVFSEQLVHAAGEAGAERVEEWKRRNVAFVRACLDDAAEAGLLRPGVSPGGLVHVVHGSLLSLAMLRRAWGAAGDRVERTWSTLEALLRRS